MRVDRQTDGQPDILITKYTAKVTMEMQSLFTKCCKIEININASECLRTDTVMKIMYIHVVTYLVMPSVL